MRVSILFLLTACATGVEDPNQANFGVDRPLPPPGEDLGISFDGGTPGGLFSMRVTNADPGEDVQFVISPNRPAFGPCPVLLDGLCLSLTPPFHRFTATADSLGRAQYDVTLPATLDPSLVLGIQAFAVRDGVVGESVGSIAVEVPLSASTVATSCSGYLEGFEDEVWPLPDWVDVLGSGGGSIAAEGYYGEFSLLDPEWHYLPTTYTVEPGTGIKGTFLAGNGRLYVGFDSNAGGTRSFVLASNTGDIRFQENIGYDYTELDMVPSALTLGAWYTFQILIIDDYTVEGMVYDPDTLDVISTLTQVYTEPHVGGGIALRSFGSFYIDQLAVECP
jgi:hypothetical protein